MIGSLERLHKKPPTGDQIQGEIQLQDVAYGPKTRLYESRLDISGLPTRTVP